MWRTMRQPPLLELTMTGTSNSQYTALSSNRSSQLHPIHDQMTPAAGTTTSTGQPGTATGLGHGDHSTPLTSTSAGPTATSTGLGHSEHTATGGPMGTTSTGLGQSEPVGTGAALGSGITSQSSRPGAGAMHEGMSTASIKSGIIGFGTSERQEHAALPSHHNQEENLDRNQIVGGGGSGYAPTSTQTSTGDQPSTLKQALPRT
jgi:hypothetical protein